MDSKILKSIKTGDVIVLRGKTQKGKNRIREHGELWLVRNVDQSSLSTNLGFLICPASYIGTEYLDPGFDTTWIVQNDGYCRWINRDRDSDFEILERKAN